MYNVSIFYNKHEDVLYTAKTLYDAQKYVAMLRESCGEGAILACYPVEEYAPAKGKWALMGRVEEGGSVAYIPYRLKDITLPDEPSNHEYHGDWTTLEQAREAVIDLLLSEEEESRQGA